jgi:hypothetical protein
VEAAEAPNDCTPEFEGGWIGERDEDVERAFGRLRGHEGGGGEMSWSVEP